MSADAWSSHDPTSTKRLTKPSAGKKLPKMNGQNKMQASLEAAVERLLRPLGRLMLRHAVPFATFEEIGKKVFVQSALDDFAIPNKKPSISRASVLTGLTRKDVQRIVAEPLVEKSVAGERYNRAAKVLTAWTRDKDFLDAKGAPNPLAMEGEFGFAALVRRHSGDVPVRAVLDELLRVGAVKQREDERIEAVTRAYVPQQSTADKLDILGSDVADMIDTIDHNLEHGASDPRFQRKVMYQSMPVKSLPAFRKLSAAQAQALLEKMDDWLAAHDVGDVAGEPEAARARVGLGIYYFEERLTDDRPAKESK